LWLLAVRVVVLELRELTMVVVVAVVAYYLALL